MEDDTFLLGLARSEPDAGTDSHFLYDEPGASIQTYAVRDGDEYVINGTQALHLVRRHRQALLPVRAHGPQGPHLDQPELLPAARRRAGLPHRPLPQQARPAHARQRRARLRGLPHPGRQPHRQRGRGLGHRGRVGRPAEGLVQDAAGRAAALRAAGRGGQPRHRAGGVRGGPGLRAQAHPGRQADHRAPARGDEAGRAPGAGRGGSCAAAGRPAGRSRPSTTTTPRSACW